jgi:hypothetical protein
LPSRAPVGYPIAQQLLGAEPDATTLYVRTDPDTIDDTRTLLPATANPENPEEVAVSRPSDVLEARAAAETAYTSLFLGLGAVALLVGGVGIANVMVISVLERRSEIGLRRALGAGKRHISVQFLPRRDLRHQRGQQGVDAGLVRIQGQHPPAQGPQRGLGRGNDRVRALPLTGAQRRRAGGQMVAGHPGQPLAELPGRGEAQVPDLVEGLDLAEILDVAG